MSKIPVLVWLPAAFVLGGLVGYYGPAEELRMQELRAKEEREKEKAKPSVNNAFGSFAQMVNIPAEARRPRKRPTPPGQEGAADTNAVAEADASGQPAGDEKPQEFFAPEDLRARIDEAADLWRTRIEIARTAAVEKLGLNEEGRRAFNAAVDTMNDRLRESMQIVADEIAANKTLTPELGVRLMGDLSTSLAETYDAIGETVSEDMRAEVSSLELFSFIDPSVAEPLISVQDKLDPQSAGGQRK